MLRRGLVIVLVAAGFVVATAGVASAHTAFEPFAVSPGSIVDVRLGIANENSSGTVKVELFFPENVRIPVVTITPVDGWTGQEIGGTPTRQVITWTRVGQATPDDPEFPITLGPMPDQPERLQFQVIQTYADGAVDRWIDPSPAGGPEPPMPGPTLDLEPGTAGIIPPPSSAPTGDTSATTVAPGTSSTTLISPAPTTNDDDSSNTGWIIGAIVAVIVIGGGVAFFVVRRRNAAKP